MKQGMKWKRGWATLWCVANLAATGCLETGSGEDVGDMNSLTDGGNGAWDALTPPC